MFLFIFIIMSLLKSFSVTQNSVNKFDRKEMYTLFSLPYKKNDAGDEVCYIKFLLDSVFIKSFHIPSIENGVFIKDSYTNSNNEQVPYLKGKKVYVKAYEANKLLDAIQLTNTVFKKAVIKYLLNTENPELESVATTLESMTTLKEFNSFWFSKSGTPYRTLKVKLLEFAPELYQVLRSAFERDIGVTCLCNIIPNYVSDDGKVYSDPNYKVKDTDITKEVEGIYQKYNPETRTVEEIREPTTIHELVKSDDIDSDLTRTPVRLLSFKLNHYKKMVESLSSQLSFIDGRCGLDTNSDSFIVSIKKVVNGKDSYPFTVITSKKVHLTEVEKNLLRWPVDNGLVLSDEKTEERLNELGYNDPLITQVVQENINKSTGVSFQESLVQNRGEIEDVFSSNEVSNEATEEFI